MLERGAGKSPRACGWSRGAGGSCRPRADAAQVSEVRGWSGPQPRGDLDECAWPNTKPRGIPIGPHYDDFDLVWGALATGISFGTRVEALLPPRNCAFLYSASHLLYSARQANNYSVVAISMALHGDLFSSPAISFTTSSGQ